MMKTLKKLVIKPIEDAVSTISGIDELTSQATEGIVADLTARVGGQAPGYCPHSRRFEPGQLDALWRLG